MIDDYSRRMAELQSRFLGRAKADRQAIAAAAEAEEWTDVRRLAHGLAGIAGTFGFAGIGDAAFALEQAIDEGSESDRADACRNLDQLLAAASSKSS